VAFAFDLGFEQELLHARDRLCVAAIGATNRLVKRARDARFINMGSSIPKKWHRRAGSRRAAPLGCSTARESHAQEARANEWPGRFYFRCMSYKVQYDSLR